MTPGEEQVVAEAATAVKRFEAHLADPSSRAGYSGRSADDVVSSYLKERDLPTDGQEWSRLIREVARRAWGEAWLERKRSRPWAEPQEERELRYHDRYRPASGTLDHIDQEAA